LSVSVDTRCAGQDSEVTNTFEDDRLDDDTIAQLSDDLEHFRLENIRQRNIEKAREAAVSYCRDVRSKSERLMVECIRVINLLGTNQVNDEEDVAQKKGMVERLLKEMCRPAGVHQQQPPPSAKRPRNH